MKSVSHRIAEKAASWLLTPNPPFLGRITAVQVAQSERPVQQNSGCIFDSRSEEGSSSIWSLTSANTRAEWKAAVLGRLAPNFLEANVRSIRSPQRPPRSGLEAINDYDKHRSFVIKPAHIHAHPRCAPTGGTSTSGPSWSPIRTPAPAAAWPPLLSLLMKRNYLRDYCAVLLLLLCPLGNNCGVYQPICCCFDGAVSNSCCSTGDHEEVVEKSPRQIFRIVDRMGTTTCSFPTILGRPKSHFTLRPEDIMGTSKIRKKSHKQNPSLLGILSAKPSSWACRNLP